MRVALVRPVTINKLLKGKWLKTHPYYVPPLGLMCIASALELDNHDIQIIDAAHYLYSDEDIVEKLYYFDPDVIGIGGVITNFVRVKELTKKIRDIFHNTPIVFGGQMGSHIPHIALESTECDIVVHGLGEKSTRQVVQNLSHGQDLSNIKGISYINDYGKVQFNGFSDITAGELNNYPLPAYHLVDLESYINGLRGLKMKDYIKKNKLSKDLLKIRSMRVIANLGCYGKCTFCVHKMSAYNKMYIHTLEKLMQNIGFLYEKYNIRNFFIGEDMFLTSKRRAKDFVRRMNEKYSNAYYSFTARAGAFDEEMVEILESGKCTWVMFGFESGSQKMLNFIKKGVQVEQNIKAHKLLKRSKLGHSFTTFVGHPGETYETVKATADALRKCGNNISTGCFYAKAFPGSELYFAAIKAKIITDEEDYLSLISDTHITSLLLNLTPYHDFILKQMKQYVDTSTAKLDWEMFKEICFKKNGQQRGFSWKNFVTFTKKKRQYAISAAVLFGYFKLGYFEWFKPKKKYIEVSPEGGFCVDTSNWEDYFYGGCNALRRNNKTDS